ncbi:hypothetical protein ISCGN_027121 [Ixodes scapularis]
MTGPSPALKVPPLPSREEVNLFFPVTAQQIPSAEKAVNSAAGLDRFSASLLKSVPALLLRVLRDSPHGNNSTPTQPFKDFFFRTPVYGKQGPKWCIASPGGPRRVQTYPGLGSTTRMPFSPDTGKPRTVRRGRANPHGSGSVETPLSKHLLSQVPPAGPDIVAHRGAKTVVLDAQVVGTSRTLGFQHEKYSLPDLLNQAPESAHGLKSLGLTGNDFKLIAIRCLQGGVQCFRLHRRMTTVVKAMGKEADTLPARSGLPAIQVGGRTLDTCAHNQNARTSRN